MHYLSATSAATELQYNISTIMQNVERVYLKQTRPFTIDRHGSTHGFLFITEIRGSTKQSM